MDHKGGPINDFNRNSTKSSTGYNARSFLKLNKRDKQENKRKGIEFDRGRSR